MPEYILLMHNDAATDEERSWDAYLGKLKQSGAFEGGSAIGDGICVKNNGPAPSVTAHLTGYIRVSCGSLDAARALLAGNPHFEAGGTVEIRELPRT